MTKKFRNKFRNKNKSKRRTRSRSRGGSIQTPGQTPGRTPGRSHAVASESARIAGKLRQVAYNTGEAGAIAQALSLQRQANRDKYNVERANEQKERAIQEMAGIRTNTQEYPGP